MEIPFSKYEGTGNDFIIIDNRTLRWVPTGKQVAWLCDRHFGIGADGLMLLSEREGFDFGMTYYNSDGREASMCGNGGRCITAFAGSIGLIGREADFMAADGRHLAEIIDSSAGTLYRISLKDTAIGREYPDGIFLDTGSPHFVVFTGNALAEDVVGKGRKLRYDPRFAPGGTNVDFVEARREGLFVRTYERGVENETLSCGTGVTASALAAAYKDPEKSDRYDILTPGGRLRVTFRREGAVFSEIRLEGPAKVVFEGKVNVAK